LGNKSLFKGWSFSFFFLLAERQLLLAERQLLLVEMVVVVVVKGLLNRQAYFLDLGSFLFDL